MQWSCKSHCSTMKGDRITSPPPSEWDFIMYSQWPKINESPNEITSRFLRNLHHNFSFFLQVCYGCCTLQLIPSSRSRNCHKEVIGIKPEFFWNRVSRVPCFLQAWIMWGCASRVPQLSCTWTSRNKWVLVNQTSACIYQTKHCGGTL